jgi:hypothetical protein
METMLLMGLAQAEVEVQHQVHRLLELMSKVNQILAQGLLQLMQLAVAVVAAV